MVGEKVTIGHYVTLLAEAKKNIKVARKNRPSWYFAQYVFAANNVFPFPANQTVSNPIKAAEDTLQIIRAQTGGSE